MNATRNMTRNVTRRGVALVVVALLASLSLLTACGSTSSSGSLPPREPPSGEHQLTAEDVNAWLDGKLPDALKNGDIPGAVVTVVKDGQVVTTRGYGWADTGASGGQPVAVDPQTSLFRVASISKIPTSIAAMQLVEQGKVDLDTDISAYLDFEIERRFDEPLTLRHLLTHSAGFDEHGSLTPGTDLEAYVKNDPPAQVFVPGTTPGYSNYGMALAGYIVQRVSGQPFETYVREHVLEPAGMTTSTYEQPLPAGLAGSLGPGYTSTGEEVPFEVMGDFPAGSLTVSAPDFAAFMNAQLSRSPKLLREETWEQMWSPGLGEDKLGNRAKAGEMGLGYFELTRHGRRIVEHSGDHTRGWHSKFELYPEEKTGIFISYNGDGNGSDSSNNLREDLAQGFADRYFPGETVKASGSKNSADRARQVAGSYIPSISPRNTFLAAWSPFFGKATIEHTGGGKLILDKAQYVEVEPWVWRQVDGRGAIAAQVKDGKVVSLSMGPAVTLLPTTLHQQALVPVFGVCLVLLLVATVAWPVGALRRRRALKRGREVGAPLPWLTRVARGGGVLALSAQLTWTLLLVVFVANSSTITDGSFAWLIPVARCAQVLQVLGMVAIIPAAVDLVMSLRRRAGWRRVTMSAVLLAALVALAWWAWAGNALVPSLGM
ncbi:serine hydrolase domain-containing protein [Actinomyces naeslundii]|uniref:serine hydrolase domain-containing protein n=1 Tax=Actinomyces naeslundii TaxID=1655 RepID=UPI0009D68603|nr:serine hydrolase domain-containing protein [Actinomyces naeslundii]